ncbi:MAG TPA: hypothetical protein VGE52_16995, partial [Pirellulales bacterium]
SAMDQARRNELRDAVRPHGDDLADALFAPLADELSRNEDSRRSQAKLARFDAALGRAIQTPPLPAGLLDRLQAALAAQTTSEAASPTLAGDADSPAAIPSTTPLAESAAVDAVPSAERRWLRRAAMWLGGTALVGLASAGAYSYLTRGDYSLEALLAAGREEFSRVPLQDGGWQAVRTAPDWKTAFADIDESNAKGRREWSGFHGLSGVVYLLQRNRIQALLFQFPAPLTLDGEFPVSPTRFEDTASQLASAWKKDSLFVLVINGSKRQAESVGYFRRRVQLT